MTPGRCAIDTWWRHSRALVLGALLVGAAMSCGAREDEFWQKIYPCDSRDETSTCGTDREGEPMRCFAGRAIGTDDFCAEACSAEGSKRGGFLCKNGALLRACRPDASRDVARGGCPAGLECFPSDLTRDEGLCLRGCSGRDDCVVPIEGCDAKSFDQGCRAPIAGRPAACFEATHLGGRDFCTEACDLDDFRADEGRAACLKTPSGVGAVLRTCSVSATDDASADCPFGLQCFRTNFLAMSPENQGLCLPIRLCTTYQDCLGTERGFCVGELLPIAFPSLDGMSADPPTDHLECIDVQSTADPRCPPGETGISAISDQDLPDVCVSSCDFIPGTDRRWPCPPTFTCVPATESPRAAPLCVPGLPGYRCDGEHSCLGGDCVDSGEGFDVCTMPCDDASICNITLHSFRGPYRCVEMPSGPHCLNAAPFKQYCLADVDCKAGQFCSFYDPFNAKVPSSNEGECRTACPDGRCPRRYQMPFTCLLNARTPDGEPKPQCYPGGVIGVPCNGSDDCIPELSCETFENDELAANVDSHSICTIRCESDADCQKHPLGSEEVCFHPPAGSSTAEQTLPGVCGIRP